MIRKEETRKVPPHLKEIEWKGERMLAHATRIVVKLKPVPETEAIAIDQITANLLKVAPDLQVIRQPSASGRIVLGCRFGTDVVELAQTLNQEPAVAYAEPDLVGEIAIVPTDTRYTDQWSMPHIRADLGWNLVTGSSNVMIGVLDTGISMTAGGVLDHPDLDDSTRYMLGTDYIDGGTPRDPHGHGTHTAGTCGAESNNTQGVVGMNWSSQIYICRTFDAGGFGLQSDTADALEEVVDYAVSVGRKVVINLSARWRAGTATLQDACKYVDDHGMILCAATGNDYGAVGWPAAYSTAYTGVIAVGSVGSGDMVSAFSNRGPEVTVVAPGEDILSTTPTYANSMGAINYAYSDGTSMATPHVTGLVSLMWSRHPGFSSSRIRNCLTDTAVKLGPTTFDNSWGFGRIDARRAIQCGDLLFTRFTRFTVYTRFTIPRFTRFTFLSTPFTRFTRFTGDPPPWRPGDLAPDVSPFIRVLGTVFAPEELAVEHFAELAPVVDELRARGVTHLHVLASTAPQQLAQTLQWPVADAHRIVEAASQLLSNLVRS